MVVIQLRRHQWAVQGRPSSMSVVTPQSVERADCRYSSYPAVSARTRSSRLPQFWHPSILWWRYNIRRSWRPFCWIESTQKVLLTWTKLPVGDIILKFCCKHPNFNISIKRFLKCENAGRCLLRRLCIPIDHSMDVSKLRPPRSRRHSATSSLQSPRDKEMPSMDSVTHEDKYVTKPLLHSIGNRSSLCWTTINNFHNPNFRGWDGNRKYESGLWSNNSCLLPPCLGNTKLLWTGKVSSNFHLITAHNDLEKAEIFDPVYKSLKVNYSEENDGSWSRQPVQCTMGSRDFKLSNQKV